VGIDQNKVSNWSVDGVIGESGISTIILDVGTDLADELQGLLNNDNIPLTNLTTILLPI
jgi:hypothetical protein